ncbi:MAG: helix-turn-helix domain-containing protein [Elusimicrobia bacterium]|nr:helix-turn-helix domain-containing protein [Elusimicrobiota bacterium]
MNEQLLTLKEFAQRYKVSTKTAGKWIRRFKDLEVIRIGRKFYFSLDTLREWEQNRKRDFENVFRPKEIL